MAAGQVTDGDGLWGQWQHGALAIRSLAHVTVAAESTHGRSVRLRTALLAASLTADVLIARRRRSSRHRSGIEVLVNAADVAAWSWLTRRDLIHLRALSFATVAPNLMETGFRLRAGTTAVPVLQPPIPWHPLVRTIRRRRRADRSEVDGASAETPSTASARPRRLGRVSRAQDHIGPATSLRRLSALVARLALDTAPTLGAMAATRRVRGLRIGFGPFGWAAIGAWGGFSLARVRDRAQATTTRVWDERTRYLIEEARIASRVQAALLHNATDVDPKALLSYLERAGSVAAGEALDALMSGPAEAVADAGEGGITLVAAVDLRAVEPARHRTRWIPRSQVRVIRDAMAAIDASLAHQGLDAPEDDEVAVVSTDARLLVLDYRGERIEVAQPTPDLAIRLEPTVWAVVASAAFTVFSTLSPAHRASGRALTMAFALHGVALFRLVRTPAMSRKADRLTAALILSSALILDVSIGGRSPQPLIDPETGQVLEVSAGTSATQSVMMLVGTSSHDLHREAPWLFATAVAGWLYSLRLHEGRSWHSFLAEASFLVMPLLANLGVGARTRSEAELLDEVLQARLSTTIDEAARTEARAEIDRFLGQLDCVIRELPALHPGLGDAEVAAIVETYENERARIAQADPLELIGW